MATMAEAKRDFGFGLIKGAKIYNQMGYLIVELQYSANLEERFLTDARDKLARQFKTYDAAIRACEQVGFKVDGVAVLG